MAPTRSKRTIRIQGLKLGTSHEELEAMVTAPIKPARWSKKKLFPSSTASTQASSLVASSSTVSSSGPNPATAQPSNQPTCTLALHNAGHTQWMTATVTYASGKMKAEAVKRLEDSGTGSLGAGYECGDGFERLTVLYASETADVDICAVHGLAGNAFDTWMGTSKMWLRDLLPNSTPFNRSRIMAFGYNSTLINKKSNDRIRDWADELLRNVGSVRTTPAESARPIIFICHSLGGIVGREAMTRLNTQATKFDGIKLENCGLLFLSTPHSGTAEADWSVFLTNLSELVFGVRSHEIIDQLRSFNQSSVDSEEAFRAMTTVPPFHCLCEGDDTFIGGKNRQVVAQASAGFCGQTADKILSVDHHTICKFDTGFGGYIDVLSQLGKIRATLLSRGIGESCQAGKTKMIPGRPSIVAPHYPLNESSKWFEGSGLRTTSHLIGRDDTVNQIMESIRMRDYHVPKLIALTGVGGIGKTEILLEAAFRFKDVSHVFFVQAIDTKSLERAFLEIAGSIGHDILSQQYPHADLAAIWRAYKPKERIRAFKAWLSHPSNQPSLFIVDDLDGLKDEALIKTALPREAHIILYSTRNPSLIGSLERESQQHLISDMDISEIAPLMLTKLRRSGVSDADISDTELEAIANVVNGHPLAACRAIAYILNVLSHTTDKPPASIFLTMFGGADWKARLRFFLYKPRIGLSIMETFAISLERMRGHQIETLEFLELLAFVSGRDQSLNFRNFLGLRRPWLKELQPHLQDYKIFARGLIDQSEYLAELESVSIGVRPYSSSPLQIHPLWLECIQQRAGSQGRVRWLRQILMISHGSWARDEQESFPILYPFIYNALWIAERFGIPHNDIADSLELRDWVDSLSKHGDCPSVDPDCEHNSARPAPKSSAAKSSSRQGPSAPEKPIGERQIVENIIQLRNSCQQVADTLNSSTFLNMSDDALSSSLLHYQILLRRLRSLEEEHGGQLQEHATADLHCDIYNILIEMAPFEHRNPVLGELLQNRKTEWRSRKSIIKEAQEY